MLKLINLSTRLSENDELAKKGMLKDLDIIRMKIENNELSGVAFAYAHKDDRVATGWSGYGCRPALSFAVSLLQHRYHAAILEEEK